MLLKIIVVVFGVLVAVKAFISVKRNEFTFGNFLLWLVVWGLAMFFVFFQNASSQIADFIGVGRGADALVYLSILAIFYSLYKMYTKFEKLERDFTKLVRHEALKSIKKPSKKTGK